MICAEVRKGQTPSITSTVTTMNHSTKETQQSLFSTKILLILDYSNTTV